jgi:hypothetical protein
VSARNGWIVRVNAKFAFSLQSATLRHAWKRPAGPFSFISINWRGRPLRSYETVVKLISNTTNRGGLVVRARLDRKYPTGKKVSAKEMRALSIERNDFHGDWNYVVRPRPLNV